jgi:hypothetical protein
VTIAGREVSDLERGNFVGEAAFLTEMPTTATVIAEGDVPALAFESHLGLVGSSARRRKLLASSSSDRLSMRTDAACDFGMRLR